MGKKDKKGSDAPTAALANLKIGPAGGVHFSASSTDLDAAKEQTKLEHTNAKYARDSYDKAKSFLLEQRQKLEGLGWSSGDAARTELYVLKRNAPHGVYTEDGLIHVRVPKKFIDFTRSGKGDDAGADEAAAEEEGAEKKKKTSRVSKKKENAPSYELNSEAVWKIRIDGEADNADQEPSVMLDVLEPLENIFYLVMALQPGLAKLHATRKDVIQPGTQTTDVRDDAETPTTRHRAMVASTEVLTRVLPPAFWFRRNETELRKIFSDAQFDEYLKAADSYTQSNTRDVKDIKEKIWEEKAAPAAAGAAAPAAEKKKSAKKGKAEAATAA